MISVVFGEYQSVVYHKLLRGADSCAHLNIHGILPKLCYGKIIQVFGEFKLLGLHPHICIFAVFQISLRDRTIIRPLK